MNDLTTIRGFYETYLRLLPQHKTSKECFEYLNAEVEQINGEKMFFNYTDFEIRTFGKGLEDIYNFTKTYFNLLGYFPTQKECFEYIHGIQNVTAKKPLFKGYTDFRKKTMGG